MFLNICYTFYIYNTCLGGWKITHDEMNKETDLACYNTLHYMLHMLLHFTLGAVTPATANPATVKEQEKKKYVLYVRCYNFL